MLCAPKIMRKIIINLAGIMITLFAIITVFSAIYNHTFFESKISELINSFGALALLYLTLFLELIPNYVSPHLGIFSAILLGINPLIATLAILCGSLTASLLGFEIGRIYGKEFITNLFGNEIIEKIERKINKKGGKTVVLLASISPLPYLPMVIGSLKMDRKKFIIWGIIPREISYIIVIIILSLILN
jgi:membrane protein YqaA with SNARE-associated domain